MAVRVVVRYGRSKSIRAGVSLTLRSQLRSFDPRGLCMYTSASTAVSRAALSVRDLIILHRSLARRGRGLARIRATVRHHGDGDLRSMIEMVEGGVADRPGFRGWIRALSLRTRRCKYLGQKTKKGRAPDWSSSWSYTPV